MNELSKNVKISQGVTPTAGAAGATDIEGAIIDMQGYEGVLMIVPMGTIVAGALTSIKARQGDLSGLGDAADIAGSLQTIADTDDNKTFCIDIKNPTARYLQAYIARSTSNATVGGVTYIQYGARKVPVTQGTSVTVESFVAPVEGTA